MTHESMPSTHEEEKHRRKEKREKMMKDEHLIALISRPSGTKTLQQSNPENGSENNSRFCTKGPPERRRLAVGRDERYSEARERMWGREIHGPRVIVVLRWIRW